MNVDEELVHAVLAQLEDLEPQDAIAVLDAARDVLELRLAETPPGVCPSCTLIGVRGTTCRFCKRGVLE